MRSLQIASTTFIIPFAIIFNKPLLAFPDVSFSLIMPVIEVMATQFACAIMCFGYCFGKLGWIGRVYFGAVVAIGYVTLTQYGRPVMLDLLLLSSLASGMLGRFVQARMKLRTAQ